MMMVSETHHHRLDCFRHKSGVGISLQRSFLYLSKNKTQLNNLFSPELLVIQFRIDDNSFMVVEMIVIIMVERVVMAVELIIVMIVIVMMVQINQVRRV